MKVLDHGYVNLVESWGSDERIIEAARMSTDKGFKGWGPKPCPECTGSHLLVTRACSKCHGTGAVPGDEKLLKYLYTHKHMSPFEMGGLIVEIQAPIFVFREWHRHRTQSYNELSGRYSELPNMYYIPSVARLMNGKQAIKNKQSSNVGFTEKEAFDLRADITYASEQSRKMYDLLLERGVARELARLVVPVNQYSRMRASANLRNWLAFLELRQAEGAQWEIRQYAHAVAKLVEENFPRTYALFKES